MPIFILAVGLPFVLVFVLTARGRDKREPGTLTRQSRADTQYYAEKRFYSGPNKKITSRLEKEHHG